jgi:hypothetical protein
MNKQFEVTVNPFKREVHIARIKEGQELEIDPTKRRYGDLFCDYTFETCFNKLNEQQTFVMGGKKYKVHFLYEDDFSLNIYEIGKEEECLVYILDVIFFMGEDNCVSGRFAQ